jgi:phosphoglycolate phosphatase-like HAD superfamily hydrolase
MLLTGNIASGAEAKLRHYGLWEYFAQTGGAFSVEGSDRASIARAARALLQEPSDGDRTYVIGDTPHDVSCGKVIGARTLAVATGPGYSLEELQACDPWRALEALPAPGEFVPMITSA